MKALEFGDSSKRKLVLIHGFQMPYQIWNKYIDYYSSNFHIIVPILPGHYPNHEEDFVSFSVSAEEFENYYIRNTARMSLPFTQCLWAAF